MNKIKLTVKEIAFTPFRYIAGWKSLAFGVLVMLLLSLLGYFSTTYFDGALDVHYGCELRSTPYLLHLWYQLSGWLSMVCILFIIARIASSSRIRFVDMAGTLALSRFPLIFSALVGFIPNVHLCFDSQDMASMMTTLQANWGWMIFLGFTFIFVIWWVVLMYNAFSVSGNLKGAKGGILFALGLLLSEILATILNHYVVPIIM